MAAPLTESAIEALRTMIVSGALAPGSRLPPEAELATELGASRNTVREAVRALVTARVLDVKRGDGTYVTSLRPELLLEGIGAAVELMQEGFSLELIAVRRILEPAATAMAATSMDDETLAALEACMARMEAATSEAERIGHDADFHALVAKASGNATLASMLSAVSSRTIRARAWRGLAEEGASARTVVQHREILGPCANATGARRSRRTRPRGDDRSVVPGGRRCPMPTGPRARTGPGHRSREPRTRRR